MLRFYAFCHAEDKTPAEGKFTHQPQDRISLLAAPGGGWGGMSWSAPRAPGAESPALPKDVNAQVDVSIIQI